MTTLFWCSILLNLILVGGAVRWLVWPVNPVASLIARDLAELRARIRTRSAWHRSAAKAGGINSACHALAAKSLLIVLNDDCWPVGDEISYDA